MDLDEIKLVLDMMREHDLAEFELERNGVKLRLRKNTGPQWNGAAPPMPHASFAPSVVSGVAVGNDGAGPPTPVLTPANEDVDLAIVKSPIVGTFFRSTEPGAKPFTDVGQTVKRGEVLCIIEAMKLMNEINAECDGEIIKVYVENGQAVHYGERLFAIKPA
jgi:acetyl-CoA carboxylase biotin carboxyl carrier protein